MKSIQQAVATPVVLIADDGQEYRFSPITPKILSEFCNWINGIEGRRPGVPIPSDEMMDKARTLDGMLWLIWWCCKANHPQITKDEVRDKLLTSVKTMQEIYSALMDMGDEESQEAKPDGPLP